MDDRFRFRVWFTPDYQEPEMIYDAEQTYDNRCQGQGSYHHDNFGEILEDKNCIVMQCTGLKDCMGKLIYEGDIVNDKSNHIRVVVWEQDCFKYPALKTSRYFHRPISNKLVERKIDLRAKLTFQDAIGKCDKKYFEVIGNIYENPELLEDNNG